MAEIKDLFVPATDPGEAATLAWAASVLFATVSGYNAENEQRKACGHSMAYVEGSYVAAIEDAHLLAVGRKSHA